MAEMTAAKWAELARWLGESEAVVRRMTVKELCDATIRRIEQRGRERRVLPNFPALNGVATRER